jgi:hypothetical protein
MGRAAFLPETEQAAYGHDDQDDGRVGLVVQEKGQHGGEDQDQDDGAFELGQKKPRVAAFGPASEVIGPSAASRSAAGR